MPVQKPTEEQQQILTKGCLEVCKVLAEYETETAISILMILLVNSTSMGGANWEGLQGDLKQFWDRLKELENQDGSV